jgi:hypothetical protein
MNIGARQKRFEQMELFGKPVLFTGARVDPDDCAKEPVLPQFAWLG